MSSGLVVVKETREECRREEKEEKSQLSCRWTRALASSTHTSERSGGCWCTRDGSIVRTASTGPRSVGVASTVVGGVKSIATPTNWLPYHSSSLSDNEEEWCGCGLDHVSYRKAPNHHHCSRTSQWMRKRREREKPVTVSSWFDHHLTRLISSSLLFLWRNSDSLLFIWESSLSLQFLKLFFNWSVNDRTYIDI